MDQEKKTSACVSHPQGSYSVDEECIACDACVLVAPEHFKINEDKMTAYVCRQPQTPREGDLCQEALEACPVEAIHKN